MITRLSQEEPGIKAASSVETYLAALPGDSRKALERLRKTIRAAAPEATEAIAYGMPVFKDRGRSLVGYAAFKDHCSLFPMSLAAIAANRKAVAPYLSGKATLRFTVDEPLPAALVKKIVAARIEENAARR